jgi:hypothetical protein
MKALKNGHKQVESSSKCTQEEGSYSKLVPIIMAFGLWLRASHTVHMKQGEEGSNISSQEDQKSGATQ